MLSLQLLICQQQSKQLLRRRRRPGDLLLSSTSTLIVCISSSSSSPSSIVHHPTSDNDYCNKNYSLNDMFQQRQQLSTTGTGSRLYSRLIRDTQQQNDLQHHYNYIFYYNSNVNTKFITAKNNEYLLNNNSKRYFGYLTDNPPIPIFQTNRYKNRNKVMIDNDTHTETITNTQSSPAPEPNDSIQDMLDCTKIQIGTMTLQQIRYMKRTIFALTSNSTTTSYNATDTAERLLDRLTIEVTTQLQSKSQQLQQVQQVQQSKQSPELLRNNYNNNNDSLSAATTSENEKEIVRYIHQLQSFIISKLYEIIIKSWAYTSSVSKKSINNNTIETSARKANMKSSQQEKNDQNRGAVGLYRSMELLHRMIHRYRTEQEEIRAILMQQQQQQQQQQQNNNNSLTTTTTTTNTIIKPIHPKPTEIAVSYVLLSCSSHFWDTKSVIFAEQIMKELQTNVLLYENNLLHIQNSKQQLRNHPLQVQQQQIQQQQQDQNNGSMHTEKYMLPSIHMYNNIILLYAKRSKHHYGSAALAEDWLLRMASNIDKISTTQQQTIDAITTSATTTGSDNDKEEEVIDIVSSYVPPIPETSSFNRVLKAWCDSPEVNGADRANELLQLMKSSSISSIKSTIQPDDYSFTLVCIAYSLRNKPWKSEDIFRQAVEYYYNRNIQENAATQNQEGQQNNNNTDMNTIRQQTKKNKLFDGSIEHYNNISNSNTFDNEMNDVDYGNTTKNKKDTIHIDLSYCLNTTINAWALCTTSTGSTTDDSLCTIDTTGIDNTNIPERCEQILNDAYTINKFEHTGTFPSYVTMKPNSHTHMHVIEAYTNRNRIEDAENHIQQMIKSYNGNLKEQRKTYYVSMGLKVQYNQQLQLEQPPTPNLKSFNLILSGYNLRFYDNNNNNNEVKTTTTTTTTPPPPQITITEEQLLDSAQRSYDLVKTMIRFSNKHGDIDCIPTTTTFTLCIDTCYNAINVLMKNNQNQKHSSSGTNNDSNDNKNKSNNLAMQMQKLARYTFELLNIAEQRRLSDTISYTNTINSLCRASDSIFHTKSSYDSSSVNTNSVPSQIRENSTEEESSSSSSLFVNDDQLAFRAADVLRRYENEVDRRNIEWDSRVTAGLYTAVITSLSKLNTAKGVNAALDLIHCMEHPQVLTSSSVRRRIHASISAYTAIIFALSKKHMKNNDCTQKVYQLFEIIQQKDSDPQNKLHLDRLSCSGILRVLVNNTNSTNKIAAEYAVTVLSYMLQAHLNNNNNNNNNNTTPNGTGRKYFDIEPDANCYGACLEALIQTHDPIYVMQCIQLLKTIIELYQQGKIKHLPTRRTFATIINGCNECRTEQLNQEAKVVQLLMDRLQLSDI